MIDPEDLAHVSFDFVSEFRDRCMVKRRTNAKDATGALLTDGTLAYGTVDYGVPCTVAEVTRGNNTGVRLLQAGVSADEPLYEWQGPRDQDLRIEDLVVIDGGGTFVVRVLADDDSMQIAKRAGAIKFSHA